VELKAADVKCGLLFSREKTFANRQNPKRKVRIYCFKEKINRN